MPVPIRDTAAGLDLSPRVFTTTTVAASPAAAAETVIATITTAGDIAAVSGAVLLAWAALTIGTSGTAVNMRIRKTNVSGTIVAATGDIAGSAAALTERHIVTFDSSPTLPGQVYVVTLQVTSGSAPSTVSAVTGVALVV